MKYTYIKMKILLIFSFLIINFSLLISQDTWEHVYDPYPFVDGYNREDVVKCLDGGYAFCGSGFVEDPWNPGMYEEYFGFTMKVDQNGILEWVYKDTINYIPLSKSSALAHTIDGGFVIAVIPELAGSRTLIKRDELGNREWVINPGLAIHSLIPTEDGGVVAVGYAPWDESNIKKFSSEGELQWENRIRASELYSVICSYDGGYITSGRYYGQNNGDVAVAKTDAYGDTLWTRYLDGFGEDDKSRCVIENTNEEIIVVGDFDWGPAFFWKLDQEGETLDLEIVDLTIAWAFWNVNEFTDNTYITWGSGPNNIARYNRFNSELEHIDTMIGLCSGGDKGFIIDDSCLVFCKWPNLTVIKTLYESISADENIIYQQFISLYNYPNPFNPSTTISYELDKQGMVKIQIYNLKGQKIRTLLREYKQIGNYKIHWNGTDEKGQKVSSGVYFIRMSIDAELINTHKMLMLK
jgi:hypothetical protein